MGELPVYSCTFWCSSGQGVKNLAVAANFPSPWKAWWAITKTLWSMRKQFQKPREL